MPALASSKPKFSPPSQTQSFLNLSGTFEYLLTGQTARPRLPDEYPDGPSAAAKNLVLVLVDGWRWKNAFDRTLPFVARITKDRPNRIRPMDRAFATTP